MNNNPLLHRTPKPISKFRIAIAEDHLLLAKGLAKIINEFEYYEVSILAPNGKELINQLKSCKKPDIILLDINMPVMDGYDTAHWLTKNLPDLPIIVLTMFDSELTIMRMLQLEIHSFLKKDILPSELKHALDTVITGHNYFPQPVAIKMAKIVQEASRKNSRKNNNFVSELEVEFLKWSSQGLTNKQIAEAMYLSQRTVENYSYSLCKKLGLKSKNQLGMYVLKSGLVPL